MGQDHPHYHHAHGSAHQTRKALSWALFLNGALFIVELVAGYFTGSLALMSDAVHMLSDVAALSVALGASYLASKPTTPNHSYGSSGAEVIGALINSSALLVASFVIFNEVKNRLLGEMPEVMALPVLIVGCIGLAVNVGSAWYLAKSGTDNLNVRAALAHMAADALGSVGAIIAAIFMLCGIVAADTVVSIIIGALILFSAYGIFKDSFRVILGHTPKHLDSNEVAVAIFNIDGVKNLHDLHIWSIDGVHPLLTVHVMVSNTFDGGDALRATIRQVLNDRYSITHATIELEKESADPCGQENCT